MEKTSCTGRVRSEKVLQGAKDRNILHTIKRRNVNWIGHILARKCLLKHSIERKTGGIDVTGRQERRRKLLLDNLMEMTGYWKLKTEALHLPLWIIRFGRGYGPALRRSMDE
jgi:hypothetical protein